MNTLARPSLVCLAAACSLLLSVSAHAQVIVHGTRQIFPGGQREITVRTENVGKRTALVQAWMDDGDKLAAPEDAKAPFVLRPPVFRLDAGKSQAMRVMFTGGQMPDDRESIYWLNVLDIPPTPDPDALPTGNYLQFSLRTRLKLIYRPKGLNDVSTAPQKVQWSVVNDGGSWRLRATNPTPYYVHFAELAVRVGGKEYPAEDLPMAAPMSSQDFTIKGLAAAPTGGNVNFQYINDQGGVAAQSVPLGGH